MNTPDPAIFKRTSVKSPSASFTLVFHGSIIRGLGIDIAIEAVGLIRKDVQNVKLRIIGTGDYLAGAEQLVRRLNLEDMVIFEGQVPLEKIPGLLSDATVGLVPYHPNEATHLMLPVKLLEYATLGVPVISARMKAIEYYFPPTAVRYVRAGEV
jgi:glycosyltransferase involved in cell wall biosynthesis